MKFNTIDAIVKTTIKAAGYLPLSELSTAQKRQLIKMGMMKSATRPKEEFTGERREFRRFKIKGFTVFGIRRDIYDSLRATLK